MNCCELSLYAILRETNEKNWKKRQKIISRSDFGSFGPNLSPNNYFRGFYNYQMLDIIASYQCMQFQGKIMNQTWENGKKPSLRPDFVQISPNSGRHFFFFFFFFKNLASSIIGYHGQLSSCKITEKANDPILRKLSDGRTDGQTDGP